MSTTKQFVKQTIGWGVVLWLVGYVLGIVLFALVPAEMIGWIITPIGVLITLWVLWKRIKSNQFSYYLKLAAIWTLIAIVFDYLFLVKLFNPADGYYKLDVYLYYVLTFVLPLLVGWYKSTRLSSELV